MEMNIIAICLYLVRIIIVGVAVGVFFIKQDLFGKMSNVASMAIGIASAPMFVSFIVYLLGLFLIEWPCWFYYMVPLASAFGWVIYPKNYRLMFTTMREAYQRSTSWIKSVGGWIFLDVVAVEAIVLFYAFCYSSDNTFISSVLAIYRNLNLAGRMIVAALGISIFAAIMYSVWQMIKDGTITRSFFLLILLTVVGCGLYLGISLNGRPVRDTDRAHYEIEARYFAEDRNSWEIDNYTDERYGSALRDDHGPLWTVNLSDTYILAEMLGMADPVRVTNIGILWDYICFHILLFMTASFIAKSKKAGVLAPCLFNFYEHETTLMLWGSRDAFRFIGLLLLLLYVYNLFDEILKSQAGGGKLVFLSLFCFFSMQGHGGNVYIMLGMFIFMGFVLVCYHVRFRQIILCGMSVLVGTLFGISKSIFIYLSTGRIDSSTAEVFYNTPVITKMEERADKRGDWQIIWASYSRPVLFMMVLGMLGLSVLMIKAWRCREKETFFEGAMIAGMLFPLSGAFNWIGYEFSRWSIEQLRYRMYFLVIFAITGAWLFICLWEKKYISYVATLMGAGCFCIYLSQEYDKYEAYPSAHIDVSKAIVEEYKQIGNIAAEISDGDAFVYSEILLYYLKGNPKLLFHPYSEELIQAKTHEEIQRAVDKLNAGTIILPASGFEYHDYSLLPFWEYINESDEFGMISQEERGGSQDYVIYYRK